MILLFFVVFLVAFFCCQELSFKCWMPCVCYALHCITHIMENIPTVKHCLFSYSISCIYTIHDLLHAVLFFKLFNITRFAVALHFPQQKLASFYCFSYWWSWLLIVDVLRDVHAQIVHAIHHLKESSTVAYRQTRRLLMWCQMSPLTGRAFCPLPSSLHACCTPGHYILLTPASVIVSSMQPVYSVGL